MSDVLTRLDSLVANPSGGLTAAGILKSKGTGHPAKSKRIRFPEDIQEVIGYGGIYADGDGEESPSSSPENGRRGSEASDEEDDKEFSSLTRKNTNFNSHLQNLNGESKPLTLLGATKTKNPPLITVRPFSHRETSSSPSVVANTTTLTINKVAPMMNGQLVKKNLGSDGDEEESSDSCEDSQEEEKPKVVQVSSARLSFLNGTISYEPVKQQHQQQEEPSKETPPRRFITTSVIKNVHIKTSISRKPPILKEKPTVKITSRALLERRKSSEDEDDGEDDDDDADIDDDVISSSSSEVCSYDVNPKTEDEDEEKEEDNNGEDTSSESSSKDSTPVAAPRRLPPEETENRIQSSIKLLSQAENPPHPPQKAPIKLPLEARTSFELNRASIASALEFNRVDKSIRTSTKRKAPLAPTKEEISLCEPVVSSPGVVPKPPPLPPVNIFKNISLAITNPCESSTVHTNNGSLSSIPRPLVSNRVKEPGDEPYIESSFSAGRPLKTVPPPEPVAFLVKDQDEVRKWKEKKAPYPSSPDISGEILGSSKKSQHNFLSAAASMVINKAEAQIGAAIDESVKLKKLSEKKFSFKKFFHGSSPSLKKGDLDSSSSSSSSSSEKSCLDKEHEREILERERKSMGKGGIFHRRTRPEIIHPCTFSIDDDAAAPAKQIEVVKIIPGDIPTSRSIPKQTLSRSISSDPSLCHKEQTLSLLKTQETDSISSSSTVDTEYSNRSESMISSSCASSSSAYGSEADSSSVGSRVSHNKPKPAPPPRRHSLENFVDAGALRNSRLGLDKVHEEQEGINEALRRSDEDFRNSLLIIPQEENEAPYEGSSYKAMIQMNNEALRILFEKFNGKAPIPEFASQLTESDLCLSDFDVSKSSRLTTRIGSFYEASWRAHPLTILLSTHSDLTRKKLIPSLPTPLTFFTQEQTVPSSLFVYPSYNDEKVIIYVFPPYKLESLESFASHIDTYPSSERVKAFFALQVLSALELNPQERGGDPLAYFMARRLADSGHFSYKLISILPERRSHSSSDEEEDSTHCSLWYILSPILSEFGVPQGGSPPAAGLIAKKRSEIQRQLFSSEEGSRPHLQKAEALTKLVSKSSPILSVVEEYQLTYLLSQEEEEPLEEEEKMIALDRSIISQQDKEITYIYNV